MSSFGFSGIASGIDFRSLVNRIVAAEARPINLVEDRVADAKRRIEAWKEFQTRLGALRTASQAAGNPGLFTRMTAAVPSGSVAVRASVTGSAAAGTHQVRVEQLARAERLGSRSFAGSATPLGLEGSFRVAGRTIEVGAGDSLADLAARINGGANGGVSASLLQEADGSVRLVLTAGSTGAAGLDLVDGAGGVLQELGLLSAGSQVKHLRPDGLASDALSGADAPLVGLLGSAAGAGTVRLGALHVALDLALMSLADVAEAINTASAAASSRIAAQVETGADGRTTLVLRGTTDVEDDGGVLEALGMVTRSRAETSRRLEGPARTIGGLPASAATRLADLDGFDGLPAGTTAGDTLTLQGTRGDGTTFTRVLALDGHTTIQDVLDALNGADAFGGGPRTATATLSDDGRIVLQDDANGSSRLALSIVAHNQGGGTLTFGTFGVAERGHTAVLTAGEDARVEVDGVMVQSASNTLTGVIPGLSLQLSEVTAAPVEVRVTRDTAAATAALQNFVSAYNAVIDFVRAQSPGPTAEGVKRPPLAADGTLRAMQLRLRSAMALPPLPVGAPLTTLGQVGITVDREGRYQFDAARLATALEADSRAVSHLFGTRALSSTPAVQVAGWTADTRNGNHAVEITRAAAAASVTGAPMVGAYPDDATPDLLAVRLQAAGAEYAVSLQGGMTAFDIAQALNQQFDTPMARFLRLPEYRGAGGAPAEAGTLLVDLEDAEGGSLGIQGGETLILSGTTATGASFHSTFTVGAPGAQTLGDLVDRLQQAVGPSSLVALVGGRVVLQGASPGPSSLEVAVSVTAPGEQVIALGPTEVVEAGRGRARLEASVVDGALSIRHLDPGSAGTFEVVLLGQGIDHTAALGLAAGTYAGADVEGTIGGHAALGTGNRLVGAVGTPVQGLALQIDGQGTGVLGSVDFGRGVAAALSETVRSLLEAGPGSVPAVFEGTEASIARMNARIETMEARLERRRDVLIRRFTAMEEAIARAQGQSDWLAAQIRSFAPMNRQR